MAEDKGPRGKRGELVGSRRRNAPRVKAEVPVTLERLLMLAAEDKALKAQLLDDPFAAVAARGLALRPSEEAMLRAIPRAALEGMIDRIDVPRQRNRSFAKVVAGAVASGMVLVGTVDCVRTEPCDGMDPDSGWHAPDGDVAADGDGDLDSGTDGSGDADSSGDADADGGADAEMEAGADAEADPDGDQG